MAKTAKIESQSVKMAKTAEIESQSVTTAKIESQPLLHLGIRILVTSIILILLTILFLIFIVPFYIARQIVGSFAKLLRQDFIRLVSRRSSVWTSDPIFTSPEANITIVTIFDTKISHALLRQDFVSNVLAKFPRLKNHFQVWGGYSFWKLDHGFNIDAHMRRYEEIIVGQRALLALANRINRSPWNQGSSPWSLTLFEQYKSSPQGEITSALIFNIHHSLSDAFGAQCILTSIVGDNSVNPLPRPVNDITVEDKTETEDNTKDKTETEDKTQDKWITNLRIKASGISSCMDSIYELMKDLVSLKDVNGLRRGLDRDKHRDIDYISGSQPGIPFSSIEKIQNYFKVSTTAVMAALAGRCLQKICAHEQIRVPDSVHLMLPYSVLEHTRQPTNHQAFVFLNVPVKNGTMADRLQLVEADIRRQRKAKFSKIFESIVPLILGPLPSIFVKYLYKVDLPTGMLISIRIDEQLIFRGATVKDISFISGPLPGDQGIFFFFMKYAESLKIGMALSSTFGKKTKVDDLLQNMVTELNDLCNPIDFK